MSEQTASSGLTRSARSVHVAPRSTPARPLRSGPFVLARLVVDAASLGCAAAMVAAWGTASLSPAAFAAICAATVAAYAASGLYTPVLRAQPLSDVRRILMITAVVVMTAIAVELVQGHEGAGDDGVRFWLLAGALTAGARLSLQTVEQVARRTRLRDHGATLIVGAGRVGRLAAQRLLAEPALGLRPVGFLDKEPLALHDDGGAPQAHLPVLGASWDLEDVVREHRIEHVVVAFSTAPNSVVLDVVRRCWRLGVSVRVVPRLFEVEGVRAHTERLGALPLTALRPSDPHGWLFSVKYAIDRLVALLTLVLLAPVFGVVALAILISSGRPIFFRQRRVGRDGHVFEMLKFRSMAGTPNDGQANAPWAATMAGLDASELGAAPDRRTRLGSFLRRTSLDELPQIWNVLTGDMSLIGPRPEQLPFVELFEHAIHRYPDRHRVKSGLTGWAQINGLRGNTSLADRVEWDNFYIENWSPWLDLKILLKTIPALFSGRGAE